MQEETPRKGQTPRQERKERTTFMEGTTKRNTHKTVKITQEGRTPVWITLTTGMTQTGAQTIGAQISGNTPHGHYQHEAFRC